MKAYERLRFGVALGAVGCFMACESGPPSYEPDGGSLGSVAGAANAGQVMICHLDGQGRGRAITVSSNAVAAHAKHGDSAIGAEICGDGLDNDCDGQADEDCGPQCSAEVCDGLDNDCNGQTDEGLGAVSCGVGACEVVVQSCQDGQTQTCVAGSPSAEACNGIDDDCDGLTDDGLGTLACGTGACFVTVDACAGGEAQTCTPFPGEPESCNSMDDDCDGETDEGDPNGGGGCDTGSAGICAAGTLHCSGGTLDCVQDLAPLTEACGNGLDDDCDGSTDEDCGGGTECLTEADCADGLVCDGGTCTMECEEGTGTGCPDFAPICNTQISACVECIANADCSDGLECVDHVCVEASPCGTCPEGQTCVDAECVVADACGGCQAPKPVCNTSTGNCVECLISSNCTDVFLPICINFQCTDGGL